MDSMPASVSTLNSLFGSKRLRRPSQSSFPSVRSRRSRQTNLCSQTNQGGSTTDRKIRSRWQVLEEKVGANYKNRYVWSPAYDDALVTRDRDTDANGTLDERLFAQHDANFNVTAITNTSGTVQERMTYNPFGAVAFRDSAGSTISLSSKAWDILHQGGQQDSIGNYDFRHRILSPSLGRWLTNDPLGFEAGDNNFYGYLANGPGNGLDPQGLFQELGTPPLTIPLFPEQGTPPLTIPPFPGTIPEKGENPIQWPIPKYEPDPQFVLPPNLPVPEDNGGIKWGIDFGINLPIKGYTPPPWVNPLLPPEIRDLIDKPPRVIGGIGSDTPPYVGIAPNQPGNPITIVGTVGNGESKVDLGFKEGELFLDYEGPSLPLPISDLTIKPWIGITYDPDKGDWRTQPGFDFLKPTPIKFPGILPPKLRPRFPIETGGGIRTDIDFKNMPLPYFEIGINFWSPDDRNINIFTF